MAAKDGWDKFEIWGNVFGVLGSIAIPIVLWIGSQQVNQSLQEGESRAKHIELAIDIVRDDPQKTKEVPGLRSWAIKTLEVSLGLPKDSALSLQERALPGGDSCCIECDGKTICGYSVTTRCASCSVGPISASPSSQRSDLGSQKPQEN